MTDYFPPGFAKAVKYWQRYCMAHQYWASAKLCATYIRQGGHRLGHWPTF